MRSATATARQPATPSLAAFTLYVDGCVRQIATGSAAANDLAELQLREWLHSDAHTLDDGTPIDFTLFDAAILSIGERMAAGDAHAQKRLVHAARVLAERIYAGS